MLGKLLKLAQVLHIEWGGLWILATKLGWLTWCRAGSTGGQAIITGLAIDTHDDNMAFISVNVAKTNDPACSTSAWGFVLPLTTPLQILMFSQLLAARSNGIFVGCQEVDCVIRTPALRH